MLLKFEPGPRQLAIGDKVVLISGLYRRDFKDSDPLQGATLSGDMRVVKITRTHCHVKHPRYSPSRYSRETCRGKDWGGSAIVTVAEADQQHAMFLLGAAGRYCDKYELYYGMGGY